MRLRRYALIVVALASAAVGANLFVRFAFQARVATRVEDVAPARLGLILGTGRLNGLGEVSPVYAARIAAAVALYRAGKVEALIASGYRDGQGRAADRYDETEDMREDLAAAGVPPARIILDRGSRRSLDSVLRARCLADGAGVIVISQAAHVARALFLARAAGLAYAGFAAAEPPEYGDFKQSEYEALARFRALADAFETLISPPPGGGEDCRPAANGAGGARDR